MDAATADAGKHNVDHDPPASRLASSPNSNRAAISPGELATKTQEVVDCRRITGEDCYIVTAHVRSIEHLEEVIDRFAAYGQTTTSVVQSSPVAPRGLALLEAAGQGAKA